MTAEEERLTAARREAQVEAMAFWASALTNQALGIAVARQAVEPQTYAPEQAHALMAEAGRRLQKIPDSALPADVRRSLRDPKTPAGGYLPAGEER